MDFYIMCYIIIFFFFFSSRRRHTRYWRDWSSDVCSSDLEEIRVYSRTRSNREKFSSKMADKYRGRVKVIASPNPDEAIVDADIIVLATTSNEPIINGNLLKKGEIGRASCRERV